MQIIFCDLRDNVDKQEIYLGENEQTILLEQVPLDSLANSLIKHATNYKIDKIILRGVPEYSAPLVIDLINSGFGVDIQKGKNIQPYN